MKLNYKAIFVLFTLILAFTACDENTSNQPLNGTLLEDPNEWVCHDSMDKVSENEIALFCATLSFGDSAPDNIQNPPPISDLNAKNQYDHVFQNFIRNRE